MIGETLDLIRDQIVEQCQQVVLAKHNHEGQRDCQPALRQPGCGKRGRKRFEKTSRPGRSYK